MKKLIVLLFSCLIGISTVFAQVDEVTLVVSGEGESLDKATTIALRSAIEQAYGAFVSANTTILNDELVQDEIVTVSSGNVKKYDILNSYDKENGHVFVTLRATVSVKAMTAYAQSKGAECEFAGATIGQQVKLAQLNRDAEKKAFDNMLMELRQIAPYMFDFQLDVEEPDIHETMASINLSVKIMANDNYKAFNDLITTTMIALAQDSENDNTNMISSHCRIIYPNPVYEQGNRKKPKTLIGKLFSPEEEIKGDLYFYNPFPIDSIQNIIRSAAHHFFVYDNNNKVYASYNYIDTTGRFSLYKYTEHVWEIRSSQPGWLAPREVEYYNYNVSSFPLKKTYYDATYAKSKPIFSASGSFSFSIDDISKITKISVSQETSDFINICNEIDPNSLSKWEWKDLYAASTIMGCSDVFSIHGRFSVIALYRKISNSEFKHPKHEYLYMLRDDGFISQNTIDAYNKYESEYRDAQRNLNHLYDLQYKDARKEQKRHQWINDAKKEQKDAQDSMDAILRDCLYYEE